MKTAETVLLVTDEPGTIEAIAAALGQNGQFGRDHTCRDLSELALQLERTPVQAVLVDIDRHPTQMLAELDSITNRFDATRFIVLASDRRNEWLIEAMQAGARHFLLKDDISKSLDGVLQRLLRSESANLRTTGSAVTVLSAGGGCGATTLAVNLANELHLTTDKDSLIMDLDCCYGAVTHYLETEVRYGLADVLAYRERIDGDLVKSSASRFSKGLEVLASPAITDPTRNLGIALVLFDYLAPAIKAALGVYRSVVIDAPRVPPEIALNLAEKSFSTWVVMQLTVKDLRVARATLETLADQGIARDRLVAVINRYGSRRSMISLAEATAALEGFEVRCVANDYKSALRSVNYGRPLAEAAGRSRLRRDIKKLADELVSAQSSGAPSPAERRES